MHWNLALMTAIIHPVLINLNFVRSKKRGNRDTPDKLHSFFAGTIEHFAIEHFYINLLFLCFRVVVGAEKVNACRRLPLTLSPATAPQ